MPHQFTTSYLEDSLSILRMSKRLAEGAMAQLTDEQLFIHIDEESNSIAIIVKHMAGNMCSRWRDFLTSDGEKPDRDRDSEFVDPATSRDALLKLWEEGWGYVFDAMTPLSEADLGRTVMIRGAPIGDASHQSPGGALLVPHWPDHLLSQASAGQRVEDAHHPAEPVGRIHSRRRGRRSEPAVAHCGDRAVRS